jgi:hypothetical protein
MPTSWLRGVLLGVLASCAAGGLAAQTVRGTVTARTSGAPVSQGTVLLLRAGGPVLSQASSDDQGHFTLSAPEPGSYRLQFQRPGYRLLITAPFSLAASETLDYTLQVTALPAYELDTAIVKGQAVPRYLEGFYQRRAEGFGEFLTRKEFDRWNPHTVVDLMRRAQAFTIYMNPRRGVGGDYREFVISGRRSVQYPKGPVAGECPPLIYLDGALLGNTHDVDVDDVLSVGAIEALEFYEGGVEVPTEFQANGSSCGVMAVWSRADAGTVAVGRHRIELGAQLGAVVSAGRLQLGRAGGHGAVELVGGVDFYTAINGLVTSWSGGAVPRPGWELLLALRGQPLGARTPWYLGGGFVLLNTRQDVGQSEERDLAVLTGITLPLPVLQPMLEVQLLSPFHPASARARVFTGLSAQLRE